MKLRTPSTLVGTSIALIDSTLDNRGLTPFWLTHKPIHLVSVHQNNELYEFKSNPAAENIFWNSL